MNEALKTLAHHGHDADFVEYVMRYEKYTDEADQNVDDFKNYLDSYEVESDED